MKLSKKTLNNIVFFGLLILMITPFGRTKFNQGFAYVKTFLFSPSAEDENERTALTTLNLPLKGIANAEDINLKVLKGEVVFINYWATWCPPCRAEMPMIDKLYSDYKNKITFLFITSDTKNEVDAYFNKKGYIFPTYNVLANPPEEIHTGSLPTTFILDKKGRVAFEEYGAADWNSNKVRSLLDNLLNE